MIQVFAAPRNGRAQRLVILRNGRDEYRDSIDTDSGFQRESLLARAAARFDLPVEEMQPLDAEIVRQADVEDEREEGQQRRPVRFHRISCLELDASTYEAEYLIDGLLVAKQPCILAGGKKCLKTSLLIDLGISLAVGGCFLGRLRVNRACRVGIMTGESGLATIQETARRIAAAAGYRLGEIANLIFSETLPQFGSPEHEEALRRFIMDDALEVLVVDPAYMCLPDVDHANLFQVGEKLRGVSQVCQETGALLLLARHNRKSGKADPFSPPELEDIAWAGFQEFCRQWMLVGRRELYQPGTGEHRLWLSVGGSAGHSALWALDISEGTRATEGGRFWQVNVLRADEARQEVQDQREEARREKADAMLEADQREILSIVAKLKTAETKTALRARASFGHGRFDRAWAALVADGDLRLVQVEKGNNRSFEGWQLRDSDKP
jgi:hypothetical protein